MKTSHFMLTTAMVVSIMGTTVVQAAETKTTTEASKVIADEKPVSTSDFVKKASMGDMYEIQASEIVLAKDGTSDPAREFAQQTIKAHTDISMNLKKTLKDSNSKMMPATSLDAEHAGMISELKAINDPAALSKAYLEQMSMFHDKAQMLYENYSVNGDNADLKKFASTELPVVKSHNDHLKGLAVSK